MGAVSLHVAMSERAASSSARAFLRVRTGLGRARERVARAAPPAKASGVSRFLSLHASLCDTALRRPTSAVLYAFVTESGLLAELTREETDGESLERVQNLNKLFGMAARVGPLLRQDRVPQFIEHLDLLMEMG